MTILSPPTTAPSTESAVQPQAAVSPRQTTAQALVDGLVDHGVDTVFGIPGVQTYALFDALADAGDRIDLIGARHEQACAYMAMGYAQSTGRLGVLSVVPGPGVLNASAGLLTALGTSTPVLCLTSEIPTDYMGRGFGHVHEMPNQLATLQTVAEHAENITHPTHAKHVLARAIHHAESDRPGPTVVAAPWNVLSQEAPAVTVAPLAAHRPPVDDLEIAAAADLIDGAENPVILVGGGARHAAAEIRALAEQLQAPVIAFRSGKGVVGESSPYGFTCADGYDRWRAADLVITIGTKAELLWFRWADSAPVPAAPSINIDIDPASHTRLDPSVAVTADSRDAVTALIAQLQTSAVQRSDRAAEFASYKREIADEIDGWLQPHRSYLGAIRKALPADGFFVEGLSDRVLVVLLLPGRRTPALHHVWAPEQPRIRLPHRTRREGRQPRLGGRVGNR